MFCYCRRKRLSRPVVKKNPLKNLRVMLQLNPAARAYKRVEQIQSDKRATEKEAPKSKGEPKTKRAPKIKGQKTGE